MKIWQRMLVNVPFLVSKLENRSYSDWQKQIRIKFTVCIPDQRKEYIKSARVFRQGPLGSRGRSRLPARVFR